jgi:hypothetical protein
MFSLVSQPSLTSIQPLYCRAEYIKNNKQHAEAVRIEERQIKLAHELSVQVQHLLEAIHNYITIGLHYIYLKKLFF